MAASSTHKHLFAFDRRIGAEIVAFAGTSTTIAVHTHVSTLNILLA